MTDDDLEEFDTKARQCQPPHIASTWNLVPPVNEWYARDVPRLVAEVRRLRAEASLASRKWQRQQIRRHRATENAEDLDGRLHGPKTSVALCLCGVLAVAVAAAS